MLSDLNPISYSPNDPANSHKTFVQQAEDSFSTGKDRNAIQNLILAIQKSDDIEKIYNILFKLLPKCNGNEYRALLEILPKLLEVSSHLPDNQGNLAISLARWSVENAVNKQGDDQFSYYLDAMDYFAVAIKISEKMGDIKRSHDIHLMASHLLLRVFTVDLKKRLLDNKGTPEIFINLVMSFRSLKRYCSSIEDNLLVQELYDEAGSIFANFSSYSKPHYVKVLDDIEKGTQNFKLTNEKTITELYSDHLANWRKQFVELQQGKSDHLMIRDFQHKILKEFRNTLDVYLKDLYVVLGDPPCTFDIRALGSLGRGEPCPYSDLECMLLIENEKHKGYFQKLIQLLNFQIVSCGETNFGTHPVFTYLGEKHKSGFHFDSGGNPLTCEFLIGTPFQIASLQDRPIETHPQDVPTAPPNQVLKSTSLLLNENLQLFNEYQTEMDKRLERGGEISLRKKRALQLFKTRLEDFKSVWKTPHLINPLHIKKSYVELLNFLIADLALYFGIQETNTLDIIDVLYKKGLITENSTNLLKEAVSFIYHLRIKLHVFYKEQKEEAYFKGISEYPMKNEEIQQLEKIYWLVIRQLYHHCLSSILEKKMLVEVMFKNTDFFSLSIGGIFSSNEKPSFFLPLIGLIARESQADHFNNFKRLSLRSNLEILRQKYLNVLEENDPVVVLIDQVYRIPNRAGVRLDFLRKEKELRVKLLAITDIKPHTAGAPQVRIISSQGIRFLKPEVAKQIIDENGNLKKDYSSNHKVTSAAGIHFKQKPVHPLMEYAIHNLFYRIAGDLTPTTELVRFEVDGEKGYPVLISTTIQGKTLKEMQSTPKLENAQLWARWTWLLLCSILTRPGDGLPSNYLFDSIDNIYCVDNDISFADPIVNKGFFSCINFCSALFCHFQNRSLDLTVLNEFCTLDPDAILQEWIDDVIKREWEYLKLFSEQERSQLYDEDPNNRFKASITFYQGTLATLNMQFIFLQYKLTGLLKMNEKVTPLDLLNNIIYITDTFSSSAASGRKISHAYKKATKHPINQQLGWITQRPHNQSLSSLKSDEVCLGYIPNFEEVEKRESLSPLRAKEELFASLLHRITPYFFIGTIEDQEAIKANFKEIKIGEDPDIERQMSVLNALCFYIKYNNPISIVLQNCAVLDSNFLSSILHKGIKYLDFSFCQQIKNNDIEIIRTTCPQLQKLSLKGCSGLTSIEEKGLIRLRPLAFSSLRELNVEECLNLKTVRVKSPYLQQFIENKNPKLDLVALQSCLIVVNLSTKYKEKFIRMNLNEAMALNPLIHNDKEIVLATVKENGLSLKYASEELKKDKVIVIEAFKQNKLSLKLASVDLMKDRAFFLEAVRYHRGEYSIEFADDDLKRDGTFILEAVRACNYITPFEFSSEELKKDKIFIFEAVSQIGTLLRYADEKLRNDREIVLASVKNDGFAIQYVGEVLRNDKEIVHTAIKNYGAAIQYAGEALRNDREIVLTAVKKYGATLKYAGEALRKDREIVLEAVKKYGAAIQYADEALRNDREIVLAAVNQWGCALEYASEELKKDKEIVLSALNKDKEALRYASEELKNDKEFLLLLMSKNKFYYEVLLYSCKDLMKDRTFILKALSLDKYESEKVFKYVCEDLKKDKKFILEAVSRLGSALEYTCEEFKKDKEIVLVAVSQYGCALKFACKELKNDREVVLAALNQRGRSLEYASEELKKDKKIVLAAVNEWGGALEYANEELKNDSEIVLTAVTNDSNAFLYACKDLKGDRDFILKILKSLRGRASNSEIVLKHSCNTLKKDRIFLLEAVSRNGSALSHACDEFRNDREFVLEAVSRDVMAIKYASEELKKDKNIILAAVNKWGGALQYASEELRNDREIVSAAVIDYGMNLQYASEDLKKDKEIVLAAVTKCVKALEYASEELKKNREFVLFIININSDALIYASEDLKKDKEIVIAAVTKCAKALEYACKDLKRDRTFILEVVTRRGVALEYASEELRKDREIVLAALTHDAMALGYASEEFKKDKDLVFNIVSKDGRALQYASEDLRKDRQIVLAAISKNQFALQYASEDLRNDRQIVLAAISENQFALQYANEEFRKDKNLVLGVVSKVGVALQYASEELKKDKEIVITAVTQDGRALEYASEEFKKNRQIVLAAVKEYGGALQHTSDEFKKDKEIIFAALNQSGVALWYVNVELRKDRAFILDVVSKFGSYLKYVCEEFKKDKSIVLAAVKQDGRALDFASEELKKDKEILLAIVKQSSNSFEVAREENKLG